MTARGRSDHGSYGAHGHEGQHGAAPGERDVAQGTITAIGGTGFVLATEEGALTVVTGAGTNFHGLSRRRAREAGYEDPAAVNTCAALRVGQRVGVMGERRDDATLLARRVHGFEP
jgi:Domain of unknown function (DUF5666)